MRYEEFKDVMIANGYSIIDVMDCMRDFFRSDASNGLPIMFFNEFIAELHGVPDEEVNSIYYDVDDAFQFLMEKYCKHIPLGVDVSTRFDRLCDDLWSVTALYLPGFEDYWQDLLKDI